LYHFDLYRLGAEDELIDLGFDEYFHGEGVAVVEWAERCPELRLHALSIDISYLDESTREMAFSCSADSAYVELLAVLGGS
jgi:tRNA threonylcarbamoyladenosine biosynthesis protein TsaE